MQRQDETLASVTIEPGHGATVTYRDQCSFPELEPMAELELVCGEQRVLVSRHQVWPLEGAEWPQQHHYHFPPQPTTARPRPLSARTTTAPSWTWGSPRPRPSTASACPCRRHGHGHGGRRRDLRGRSAGRGLGLRQDDTRLLILSSSKIFRGREEEDGKQSRGGMAAGKYLWMVWHLHCWNFSDTDYFVKYTESMISILLQIALVRSQQEMV